MRTKCECIEKEIEKLLSDELVKRGEMVKNFDTLDVTLPFKRGTYHYSVSFRGYDITVRVKYNYCPICGEKL